MFSGFNVLDIYGGVNLTNKKVLQQQNRRIHFALVLMITMEQGMTLELRQLQLIHWKGNLHENIYRNRLDFDGTKLLLDPIHMWLH